MSNVAILCAFNSKLSLKKNHVSEICFQTTLLLVNCKEALSQLLISVHRHFFIGVLIRNLDSYSKRRNTLEFLLSGGGFDSPMNLVFLKSKNTRFSQRNENAAMPIVLF